MSAVKDLWMQEYERIRDELIDAGMSEEEADATAADQAYNAAGDRLADMADAARQRKKDGQ